MSWRFFIHFWSRIVFLQNEQSYLKWLDSPSFCRQSWRQIKSQGLLLPKLKYMLKKGIFWHLRSLIEVCRQLSWEKKLETQEAIEQQLLFNFVGVFKSMKWLPSFNDIDHERLIVTWKCEAVLPITCFIVVSKRGSITHCRLTEKSWNEMWCSKRVILSIACCFTA